MAAVSAAIYLFSLLVAVGPSAHFVAEAASLRAPPPERSEPMPASPNASPADLEDEEEALDDGSDEQVAPAALPNANPQPQETQDAAVEAASSSAAQLQAPPRLVSALPPAWSVSPDSGTLLQSQEQVWKSSGPQQPQVAVTQLVQQTAPLGQPLQTSKESEAAVSSSKTVAPVPKFKPMNKVPMWVAKRRSAEASSQSAPANWPPRDDRYQMCDPPCIQGRGICNDRVCFCRSPFSGSTCQHKITGLYRASKLLATGFAATCFVLGMLLAKLVATVLEASSHTRMSAWGETKPKKETWNMPEENKKNGGT